MMVFCVTGSRRYEDRDAVFKWGASLPPDAFLMDGDARGVDRAAREGFLTTHPEEQSWKRPANWGRYSTGFAGPLRNSEMITELRELEVEGHDVEVHSFWDGMSSGTYDMVAKAKYCKLKVVEHGE